MAHLIVVLSENRNLGIIATAFVAENNDEPFLNIIEPATIEIAQKNEYCFTENEKVIIQTLDNVSEHTLFKLYSKERNIKEFVNNIPEEKYERYVRPHIEKHLRICFNQLAEIQNIPLYYKSSKFSNLYENDKIEVKPIHSEAVFYFDLTEHFLTYQLKIELDQKQISLQHKEVTMITASPCTMMINHTLHRFCNIDDKKFKPFFEKHFIQIPLRNVPTYFESFVLNSIKNHKVIASGFGIIESEGRPNALLAIENDVHQLPIINLQFSYSNHTFNNRNSSNTRVELVEENGQFNFYKFKRNSEVENNICKTISSFNLVPISDAEWLPKSLTQTNDRDERLHTIISWLNQYQQLLIENNIQINVNLGDTTYYQGSIQLNMHVVRDGDWFDLRGTVQIGKFNLPFIKFRRHILNYQREYELPDHSIFILPEEWFTRYRDVFQFAEKDKNKIVISKIHLHLIDGVELKSEDENEKLPIPVLNQASLNAIATPAGLNATLRHYQEEGFAWMYYLYQNKFGGILADDMGLGKTLQTITLLLKHYTETEAHIKSETIGEQLDLFAPSTHVGYNTSTLPASIIVMPTSLIHNWENEFKKFAPKLKIYNYTGTKRLKSKDIGKILRHYHVVLTSYGIIRNDIDYLSRYHFHYIILDESQYIKNPTSKVYQSVSAINASHKMVLTGTPIENSLTDLWAQLNFVNEGLLGSINFFKNQFAAPISKNNDEERELKLQKLIHPFILRRTKQMVAKELPPVTEQTLYCDMTPEQKKVYDREKSAIRNKLLDNLQIESLEKSTFIALQGLTHLRQIANHPVLVDDTFSGSSGKFNEIMRNLENVIVEKHKVLIFSSFVKDLELLEKEFHKQRWPYAKLTGQTQNRQDVIHQFSENDNCRIFLISLKAGGVGLNLTSADYVFILNPWWNPAAELQAINRAHRIGQTQNVFVYRFISNDTIEEKIARLQERKSQLADTFINSNNPFKNLSEDDLKELFA